MARWLLPLVVVGLCGCAHSPVNNPDDPFEGFNRKVFAFNQGLDDYVAHPIAEGYVAVVPAPARKGVDNFITNITYPKVMVNELMQFKFVQFFQDVGRLLFNTTVGIAGFVDAAQMIGLPEHDEDLGQTLGYWGVGNGAFLMVPFLGPSSNRDLVGSAFSYFLNPVPYLPNKAVFALDAAGVVNDRAELLEADKILSQQLDRYIFIRNAYLQMRENLVYDGNPPIQADLFDEMEMDDQAKQTAADAAAASAVTSESPEPESASGTSTEAPPAEAASAPAAVP